MAYKGLVALVGWDDDMIYFRWRVHPVEWDATHILGASQKPLTRESVIDDFKAQVDRELYRLHDVYGFTSKGRLCQMARQTGLLRGKLDDLCELIKELGTTGQSRPSVELEELAVLDSLYPLVDEIDRRMDELHKK